MSRGTRLYVMITVINSGAASGLFRWNICSNLRNIMVKFMSCLRRDNKRTEKGNQAFSERQQLQLVNSGNKVHSLSVFHLNYPNRSTCVGIQKYSFKGALQTVKDMGNRNLSFFQRVKCELLQWTSNYWMKIAFINIPL